MDKPKFDVNGVTVDLEDYQCEVVPSWRQPKTIHTSIINGTKSITYPNGFETGEGRYSAEIIIWDTDGDLFNIEQDDVLDYYPIGDEGTHFNCIVKSYLPFKSEKDYTMINSCLVQIESEGYVKNPLRPATPVADPVGYTFHVAPISVELDCANLGATIYYTTDGKIPTKNASKYLYAISISATTTLRARAYVNDMPSRFSFVMSEVYTFDPV